MRGSSGIILAFLVVIGLLYVLSKGVGVGTKQSYQISLPKDLGIGKTKKKERSSGDSKTDEAGSSSATTAGQEDQPEIIDGVQTQGGLSLGQSEYGITEEQQKAYDEADVQVIIIDPATGKKKKRVARLPSPKDAVDPLKSKVHTEPDPVGTKLDLREISNRAPLAPEMPGRFQAASAPSANEAPIAPIEQSAPSANGLPRESLPGLKEREPMPAPPPSENKLPPKQ